MSSTVNSAALIKITLGVTTKGGTIFTTTKTITLQELSLLDQLELQQSLKGNFAEEEKPTRPLTIYAGPKGPCDCTVTNSLPAFTEFA